MSTPLPADLQPWASLAQTLASIDVSLKTIADFVQLLHTEKTGEQVYEVQRYVVGSDSEGQPCAWLYSTHPGLNFAVTRVYHDHLHKLPFPIAANAKTWDGEVAPSAEAAAKKGYFNAFPAPFSISLMPTGKMTDSGHPVRRLHRILDAPLPQQQPAPTTPPKPANGNGNKQPARPIQPPEPPWEEFEDEFEKLPPAAQEPAQAAALRQAAQTKPAKYDQYEQQAKAAEEERAAKAAFDAKQAAKPAAIDHEILAEIARLEAVKRNSGQQYSGPATPEQWGLIKDMIDKAVGNKDDRNKVLARLCDVDIAKIEKPDWYPSKVRASAIIDWLVAKSEDGKALRPYRVANGKGKDLATVLQGTWGVLATEAATEDVPY